MNLNGSCDIITNAIVGQPLSFQQWSPPNRTDEEKKWQTMDNTAWKVERVHLDGIYFRSEPYEARKDLVTCNSAIVGFTDVTRDERRQRNNTATRTPSRARSGAANEKCYGVIQDFYLHFMYPPTADQLKSGRLDKGRIDPAKVGVPWAVFVCCRWYEEVAAKHPINRLTQCQYNQFWDDCPLISLSQCLSMNIQLWPSVPFEEDDYDKDGNRKKERPVKAADPWELFSVITYH
jgi:hypothetical protein